MNETFTLHRGIRPLLISMPHVGTHIPESLRERFVPQALSVPDTDWHLERLYGFARGLGASVLVSRLSRYVVDLNRPPDNQPMYAGANNTELCPTRAFTGEPIYCDGAAPDAAEVQQRVALAWRPYHDALAAELARIRSAHGHAVLFDAHSIKGELPWLFEGTLPHLNLGSAGGTSCAASMAQAAVAVCALQSAYSHVLDGRFKGGYITRHYGNPAAAIHALQLEMSWRAYMDEDPPYAWHEARAAAVTPLLTDLLSALAEWKPAHG